MKTLFSLLCLFGLALSAASLNPGGLGVGSVFASANVAAIFALAADDYGRSRRLPAAARAIQVPAPVGCMAAQRAAHLKPTA